MAIISNDKNILMVRCACHGHAIELSLDDVWEDSIPQINVAVWHYGESFPLSWKQRFRWCWYLLKEGSLQGDDVIINEKDADTIVEFLTEKSKFIKEREAELKLKFPNKPCLQDSENVTVGRASLVQRLRRLFNL